MQDLSVSRRALLKGAASAAALMTFPPRLPAQADEGGRVLCEYLGAGAIGPVREVHVWTNRPIWPQGVERPKEKATVPATLDWDLWLGVAPERPYSPAYHPFKWRGWRDFGTGALGDIGCHSFAPIARALQLGAPTSVEATCSPLFKETFPVRRRKPCCSATSPC